MTNTVVEVQWHPPLYYARVTSDYSPNSIYNDQGQSGRNASLPKQRQVDSTWYVISGTQVYVGSANPESGTEYIFPLLPGSCWNPHSGESVEAGNCQDLTIIRTVNGTLETSRSTDDSVTPVLTITLVTKTSEDDFKAVDGVIKLDQCAAECNECFGLVTYYNNGSYWEYLCPGVGIIGGYWNHRGDPFGDAYYLIDYTLHILPVPVTTSTEFSDPTTTLGPPENP